MWIYNCAFSRNSDDFHKLYTTLPIVTNYYQFVQLFYQILILSDYKLQLQFFYVLSNNIFKYTSSCNEILTLPDYKLQLLNLFFVLESNYSILKCINNSIKSYQIQITIIVITIFYYYCIILYCCNNNFPIYHLKLYLKWYM